MGRKNRIKQKVDGQAATAATALPVDASPVSVNSAVVESESREEMLRRDGIFDSYRAGLVADEASAAKEFDKWILTLAGGALGFSLNLLRDFNGTGKQAVIVELLQASWAFFGLSIVLILTNLHVSFTAFGKCKNIADEEYLKGTGTNMFHRITERHGKIKRLKAIRWLNLISLVSFVLGVTSMAIFMKSNSQ